MISVVIPVYNEANNLDRLYERVRAVVGELARPCELLFVDDGSTDGSLPVLQRLLGDPAVRVIELAENVGQHAAVLAGFSVSRGEIVVTLDADLQNPPEEIPRLVRTMEQGDFDVVATVRGTRHDSAFRNLGSILFNRVARRFTGIEISDWGSMLRAYHRRVVDKILRSNRRPGFIPALAAQLSTRCTEVRVSHEERLHGESKYPFRALLRLLWAFAETFTPSPLKSLTNAGLVLVLTGIAVGALAAACGSLAHLSWDRIPWNAWTAGALVLAGLSLVGIRYLGESLFQRSAGSGSSRGSFFVIRAIHTGGDSGEGMSREPRGNPRAEGPP